MWPFRGRRSPTMPEMLVSERIGQFFLDGESGRDRLEYTEYGAGDAWVVLLHGQLMPRRMHAAAGPRAGHRGAPRRHPRPARPRPVRPAGGPAGLLDERLRRAGRRAARPPRRRRRRSSAVRRWAPTSRWRSPSLAPERVRGLLRRDAGARQRAGGRDPRLRAAAVRRPVPAADRPRAALGDPADPARARAVLGRHRARHLRPAARRGGRGRPRHLLRPGRAVGPGSGARSRRRPWSSGTRSDPIHPAADAAMLAEELPNAEFVRATSILEWRARPERLNRAAVDFALGCWQTRAGAAAYARRLA